MDYLIIFLIGAVASPAALIWLSKHMKPAKAPAAPEGPSYEALQIGLEQMRDRMRTIADSAESAGIRRLAERAGAEAEDILGGKVG